MASLAAVLSVYIMLGQFGTESAPLNMLDMSHILDENSTLWGPGIQKAPQLQDIMALVGLNGTWEGNNFCVGEHVGTHIDAPAHLAGPRRLHLEEIPVDRLVGPAVVIDVRDKLARFNDNYEVTVKDLTDHEDRYGRIPDGAIAVLCSGWSEKASSLSTYWGTPTGDIFNTTTHFPGFGGSSAKWLVEKRKIRGIASDSGSCDHGNSTDIGAHRELFKVNAWCVEGLANSCDLPTRGATLYAFPVKVRGGSGIPLRVVGMWDDSPSSVTGLGASDITTFLNLVWFLAASYLRFNFIPYPFDY